MAEIHDRLQRLERYAREQPKRDWISMAVGVLINIGVSLAMQPEQGQELLRFAGAAIAAALRGAAALP